MSEVLTRIPLDVLFGEADRWQPRLTRDGSSVTYLSDRDGRRNLRWSPVGVDEDRPGTFSDGPVIDYVLPYASGNPVVYAEDKEGEESFNLYRTTLGADTAPVTIYAEPGVQAEIVAVSPRTPDHLLFRANDRDPQLHDLWRHDLRTGENVRLAENPGFVEWLTDARLRCVGGVGIEPDGGSVIRVADGRGGWRDLARFSPEDAMASQVLAVGAEGDVIYLADTRGRDTAALTAVDVATGEVRTLLTPDRHDVGRLETDLVTGEPLWAVEEAERSVLHPLAPGIDETLRQLADLDDADPVLAGRSTDDRDWLIGFVSDTQSTRYVRFDRATGAADTVLTENAELNRYDLARSVPVTVPARDGLALPGYVTLPLGAAGPVPMVVRVHGGPWERDVWGLEPEVQWLAGLGIGCLQVNFRGSTGFGKRFLAAGNGEWGRAMQHDVEDAATHAVTAGWARAGKVGVWGGSYGGYASLLAATRPDLFACAVSLMPPIDLAELIRSVPPYWYPLVAMMRRSIGDPETEAGELARRSPLAVVDRIRVPLLLGYGANDPRVPVADVERFVDALRAAGIRPEVRRFDDAGHGLVRLDHRMEFYERAERFLLSYLG